MHNLVANNSYMFNDFVKQTYGVYLEFKNKFLIVKIRYDYFGNNIKFTYNLYRWDRYEIT